MPGACPRRPCPIAAGIVFVLLCYAPAFLGVYFRPDEWYAQLRKPAWTPPGWLFGPVWTLLYGMMAAASFLVWRRGGFVAQRRALGLFLFQLVLNAAWSPLFFGMHSPALAFADIVLLWLTLLATIVAFWKVQVAAAVLLLPYLGWVSFASALNLALWRLN